MKMTGSGSAWICTKSRSGDSHDRVAVFQDERWWSVSTPSTTDPNPVMLQRVQVDQYSRIDHTIYYLVAYFKSLNFESSRANGVLSEPSRREKAFLFRQLFSRVAQ